MSAVGNTGLTFLQGDRMSHAYIVSGDLADMIAMAAVCSGDGDKPCMNCKHCGKASRGVHPDITIVDRQKDKRDITVHQIRELKRDVIIVPGEASMKAYIINDADMMNRNAQNALLQMIEETPTHAVFILKTDNPSQLLPTVRSRCVEIKQRAGIDKTEQETLKLAVELFSALESGNAALAAYMFLLEKLEKDKFALFLTAAREQTVHRLDTVAGFENKIPRETLSHAERVLVKGMEMLDLNVNVGHISGFICASLLTVGDTTVNN